MSDQVRHRRRGEELESALLDAAWEELAAVGFASLTMESVAARAKTGVAVLYRRWPNKDELVLAAIVHYRRTRRVETPTPAPSAVTCSRCSAASATGGPPSPRS